MARGKGKKRPNGGGDSGTGGGGAAPQSTPPTVPEQENVQGMAALSIAGEQVAPSIEYRKRDEAGHGTEFDRLIDVYTNCFRIKTKSLISKVYHYDVTITQVKKNATASAKKPEQTPSQGDGKSSASWRMKRINFAVIEAMRRSNSAQGKAFHGISTPFDGEKNMYTNKPINGVPLNAQQQYDVTVEVNPGEKQDFSVAVVLAKDGEIDMTPVKIYFNPNSSTDLDEEKIQRYIQILDVIMNPSPSPTQVPFKHAIFETDPRKSFTQDVPQGGQLVQGTKSAVRSSEGGLMLNTDVTNAIFLKPEPVAELVREIWGRSYDPSRPLPHDVRDRLEQTLRQQQVEARHTELPSAPGKFRKYRVLGLTKEAVTEKMFAWKKKDPKTKKETVSQVSIADYFRQEHPKCRIIAPKWPCLKVGNEQNQRFLPIEACHVVANQPLKCGMTSQQQAQMTKETAKLPHFRFRETREQMARITQQIKPQLKDFGLEVEAEPILVKKCRVLPAPKLVYSTKKGGLAVIDANLRDRSGAIKTGEWRLDRDHNFLKPINLRSTINGQPYNAWGIINFSNISMVGLRNVFLEPLIKQASDQYGMQMGAPPALIKDFSTVAHQVTSNTDPAKQITNLLKAVQFPPLKLLFVILPSKEKNFGVDIYPDVKLACDIYLGIPTQCVDSDKINPDPRKRGKQIDDRSGIVKYAYLGNILQKINAKAGGVNTVMQIVKDPLAKATHSRLPPNTMILGADATHPAPGDALKYSVTSIVGSLDPELQRFASRIAIQEPQAGRQSKEIIDNFDGQVFDLMEEYKKGTNKYPSSLLIYRDGVSEGQFAQVAENEAARLVRRLKSNGLSIPVTYIVVTKRHNFRAFEVDKVGKIGNIPAGTVIDKDVVSRGWYDFYLSSHIAIKGTARAAKYTVLIDQNKLDPNLIEAVSFALCCICVRCTRSVSIPVPVMYADLSAYRARDHIVSILRPMPHIYDPDPDSTHNQQLRQRIRQELARMPQDFKCNFYYC